MDFNGKVALVTGATRGLGRAIADKLAAGGASLIITATSNAIESVAAELKEKYNVEVVSFYGDISQEETVKALFKLIEEKFGKLDICVNNAGITKDGLSMRMSAEDFDRVLTVNLRSTFLVSKEASMMMMKARYGKIVNMSSIVGIQGNVGQANYAASKAGIIGLTKSMAVELAKRNVTRVLCPSRRGGGGTGLPQRRCPSGYVYGQRRKGRPLHLLQRGEKRDHRRQERHAYPFQPVRGRELHKAA